jgi:hypothetical protein
MTKPLVTIHNAETGEVVEREMNAAEFAQYKLDEQRDLERKEAIEAEAAAKQALLTRLGITADEAKLLLK